MRIIKSLCDLDTYKLTMGQVQWHDYRDVVVRFGLTNRTTKVRLADKINVDELNNQLAHIRSLRFQTDELHYLSVMHCGDGAMFAPSYIDFLAELRLPSYQLSVCDGQLALNFEGKWPEVSLWETLALSTVNELYYRSILNMDEVQQALEEGRRRLADKIKRVLAECPGVTFSDFGTRRRFSRAWQNEVVETLLRELPQNLKGTSNVDIARRNGIMPTGTSAHEMYMVQAAMAHASDERILASHNHVLRDWWAAYGNELSIALTDTFGSDFFFRDMTAQQAAKWKGLRQDSGDPIVFGEKAIRFYEGHGLNPLEKLIVFSDGLDLDAMIGIYKHFLNRIRATFGWGTNLTNDMGHMSLSLVIKAICAMGHSTVKLSDNLAKATGSRDEVERYKRIFGYTGNTSVSCRY